MVVVPASPRAMSQGMFRQLLQTSTSPLTRICGLAVKNTP